MSQEFGMRPCQRIKLRLFTIKIKQLSPGRAQFKQESQFIAVVIGRGVSNTVIAISARK